MKTTLFSAWALRAGVVLVASLLTMGCTLENGEAPSVTGPSEFGLSVTMTASPDQLPRDGTSQSTVTVTVRDEASRPVAGRRLMASTTSGTLSASDVVTGSEGRATFSFTAPAPGTIGNEAILSVVPVGDNGGNSVSRTLAINFTGPSNRAAPVPSFELIPASPERGAPVRFDASGATDEGVPCLDLCTYAWDFGDGTTGTGRLTSHTYAGAGTFVVTLTVTDRAGSSTSRSTPVVVADVPAPQVTLTVAPNPPIAGQLATFTASTVAAPGHSVRNYQWTFGDGTVLTTVSPTVTKAYANPGTYVTTVIATDDVGQTGAASLGFTIGSSGVTATFTASPTAPRPSQPVNFNGSASTASAGGTITTWDWDFGDGTSNGSGAITTHPFVTAGTYVVRLTVTDTAGRTGTTTVNVTVTEPAAP
jgi:PKD repeat protein